MMATARVRLAVLMVAVVLLPARATAFDCVELKCPQMSSCAEAHHRFKICGHTKRDADGDGIPCEDLCGKDMVTYQARVKAQSQPGGEDEGDTPSELPPGPALGLVEPSPGAPDHPANVAPKFSCGTKRTCPQMLTCEEARFHLTFCGVTSLDRDRDGVPCNNLCR